MNDTNRIAAAHPTAHLTEEQFTDYVLGMASEEVNAHLAACDPCFLEASELQSSVSLFANAGKRWAEVQPVPPTRNLRTRAFVYSMRPLVGFAAAALAVVSIAVPIGRSHQQQTQNIAMVPTTASAATPQLPLADAAPAVQPEAVLQTAPVPHHNAVVHRTVMPASQPVSPPQDFAGDNQLMAAIDSAISTPESSNMETLARVASVQ